MLLQKKQFGRLRGNQHSNPGNLAKLSADWCCGASSIPTCEDTYSAVTSNALLVASVTIEQADGTLTVVSTTAPIKQENGKVIHDTFGLIPVTNAELLQKFIWKALELYEYDIYAHVAYEGGSLTVTHIGKTALKSITYSTGATVNLTRCCTLVALQVFKMTVTGVVGEVGYAGDTGTLASNPYDYTGIALTDAATAATLQGDMVTVLDGLAGYTYERVEVSIANASGGYTIKIFTTQVIPVSIDGAYFNYCDLSEEFICAQWITFSATKTVGYLFIRGACKGAPNFNQNQMKHIIAYLLVLCGLSLTAQTARLDCFNCTAVPKEVCIPCQTGKASTEYSQGIMYTAGPSNKTFIKKPYTMTVSGVFITLTDYTGKTITFDGTKTVHGSLTNTINTINICNCPVVGGGGGGPFTIGGDSGSGSFTTGFTMATGPVLKTTVVGSTVTIDWDVAGASANSVPYYNGSNVAWRTFATGILDDPTVGGVDATSLQSVVNNLNTAIGGGGGGSYTAANGLTLNVAAFELGGTLNRSTTITMANNPFMVRNGTYNIGSVASTGTILGVGTGIAPAGNGIIMGDISSTTAREVYGYLNALTGVGLSSADDDEGDGVIAEFFLDGDYAEIETYGQSASSSHIHLQAPTSTTVGGAELTATAPTGELNYIKVAPSFFEVFNMVQYTSHATAWAARGDRQLYSLNNDATVYRKNSLGAFGDYTKTPQAVTKYSVVPTGANAGSALTIVSSGVGVTAAYASNVLTITIPTGVTVLSADWRLVSSDVQASADPGGVTNWVQVVFSGTGGNTSITDMNVPALQKTAIPASGTLSTSNAATADLDNNPALSVVGVGGGTITLRVGGLSVGAQGYHVKFTGI